MHVLIFYPNAGDFHFLWECQRVILLIFWGKSSQIGSLCNLRDIIHRVRVDKQGKTFSVGDEFILHVFQARLIAAICSFFSISSPNDPIRYECSSQWLRRTASAIIEMTILPVESSDPVYSFHRSFMHLAFLYHDLRQAIRYEEGEIIVRHWSLWIPYFLGSGKKNYACEAANFICNLKATFPKHVAYIATHNRTVNMSGIVGQGKAIDQMQEHYNL